MSPFAQLFEMSDEALLEETGRLAQRERLSTAELIAAIAEIDARRLYLAEGCSSMLAYCVRVLRLSDHAAYDRISAARLARRHPIILERLTEGTLTLANLILVGPHLTPENCHEVLDALAGKSKREAEAVAAELRPQLAPPQFYRLQLAVSRDAWERLRRVQDLLRHSIPDGDPSRIFEKAIELLLAQTEKKKLGRTGGAHPAKKSTPFSRHIPANVRREVWDRDGGCCAFVGRQGRCGQTRNLEFHHLQPFATGGPPTAANIELRCRAHNQHEAEAFFGPRARYRRSDATATTRPGASEAAADGKGADGRGKRRTRTTGRRRRRRARGRHA